MDLSIILLNYKQSGLLRQSIRGIVNSQPGLNYEIIVVDNNSNDGSLSMVTNLFSEEFVRKMELASGQKIIVPPIITIQSEINGGFGYGHNLGIKKARGKYILILNPDIAVAAGVFEKMFEFIEGHSEIGIIGPKLIYPDGSIQDSCRRFPTSLTPIYRRTVFGRLPFAKKVTDNYLMADFDHDSVQEIDWLFGACLMIRKSILDEVGFFDERFFMYFEDLDLCRRFWERGFKVVFLPTVELVHYHQRFSAEKNGISGIFSPGGRIHLISGIKYFFKYLGKELPKRGLDK